MSANNTSGTILIKQGTLLPPGQTIETEVLLPGWNVVKKLDRHGLARKIEKANWIFFFLAGPVKAKVIGHDSPATLRRAVKRALAKREGQNFNSLEITKIVSKRFLGIPFLSITAHSRHIQEGMSLVPAKDFVLRTPITTSDKDVARKQFAAVSSSP
jgi:hypothetical protein